MKPRICILLNSIDDFDFNELLKHYLPAEKFEVAIAEHFPDNPLAYALIVPWSYKKVIKNAEQAGNVVVIHSSDLPDGKGWAPIYHAFSEQKNEYVMSAIYAVDEVDAGDIIAQVRFNIVPEYTAGFIKCLDNELSLLVINKILEQWSNQKPLAVRQIGQESYRKRRYPSDNEVDLSQPLQCSLSHLRGVEADSPAFFYFENIKYLIEVRPEKVPCNPKDVTITFPALSKTELWCDWYDPA